MSFTALETIVALGKQYELEKANLLRIHKNKIETLKTQVMNDLNSIATNIYNTTNIVAICWMQKEFINDNNRQDYEVNDITLFNANDIDDDIDIMQENIDSSKFMSKLYVNWLDSSVDIPNDDIDRLYTILTTMNNKTLRLLFGNNVTVYSSKRSDGDYQFVIKKINRY